MRLRCIELDRGADVTLVITGTAESDQDGRVVAVPDDDIRFVERPVADAGLVNSQEGADELSPLRTETKDRIGLLDTLQVGPRRRT